MTDGMQFRMLKPTDDLERFRWRAVWLSPKFLDQFGRPVKLTPRQKLGFAWGWDVFFGPVPAFKAAILLNAAVTFAIVKLA